MKKTNEYIVTYKSQEHYEVLGWVRASSVEEAIKKAKKGLSGEAKAYKVANAQIAKWIEGQLIRFNI